MMQKYAGTLFVVTVLLLSSCSLFVASPPADDSRVCVSKSKLESVLADLNITVEDLKEEPSVEEPDEQEPPQDEETPGEEPTDVPDEQEPSQDEVTPGGEPTEEPAEDAVRYFTEGDFVRLSPRATDADGDPVTFSYSAPLDADGEWQTQAGDAGEYTVTVTASDGKSAVSKQITIVVLPSNNPPVISGVSDVAVQEGETVVLTPVITDEDGDDVTIRYSGWMTEDTKETGFEDAGEYTVTVTASDDKSETRRTVRITVEDRNRRPVIGDLDGITVREGETVDLSAQATDPDGDDVTITYSSPLDENGVWQTQAGDAGTYLVTVTASDGKDEARKTATIVVESLNSAPQINAEDVSVLLQKGETKTVVLEPVVTDADGDNVQVSYSGFMTSNTRTVTWDDEGVHEVTVTATDGKEEARATVTVTVEVNTPPEFDFS